MHDHDDEERLTLGCPACYARVQADQERARLLDAPMCRIVFTWKASGRTYPLEWLGHVLPEWLQLPEWALIDKLVEQYPEIRTAVTMEVPRRFPSGRLGQEAQRSARIVDARVVEKIAPPVVVPDPTAGMDSLFD